jgi:hypothetical protein
MLGYDLEHRPAAGGRACRVQKGKELNDFQRNLLDIEILSNLRFGSLEIRGTSVTRVTNNFSATLTGYGFSASKVCCVLPLRLNFFFARQGEKRRIRRAFDS